MAKLNCILYVQDTHVEDAFVNYINHFYSVHLIDTYSSAIEMIEKLQKQHVDVLFMDMSKRDVSDRLLRMIDKPPFIIGLVNNPAEVFPLPSRTLRTGDGLKRKNLSIPNLLLTASA